MQIIHEQLPATSSRWRRHQVVNGTLESAESALRFAIPAASSGQYSNAQIDDYQGLKTRGQFLWRPPLTLTIRARFSHPSAALKGTAGFGFWNDPFGMTEKRVPTLPQAIWFFHASRPGNLKLDRNVPGHGWKAATIDAARPAALLLALLAPLAVPLMNYPPMFRALWPPIQRALNIQESPVRADMTEWHTYTIEWGTRRARFLVDGRPVSRPAPSPHGPLGCVIWMDNQFMVVTPQGRFRWGLLAVSDPQWMEVGHLAITC